jgi:hypothetical protein
MRSPFRHDAAVHLDFGLWRMRQDTARLLRALICLISMCPGQNELDVVFNSTNESMGTAAARSATRPGIATKHRATYCKGICCIRRSYDFSYVAPSSAASSWHLTYAKSAAATRATRNQNWPLRFVQFRRLRSRCCLRPIRRRLARYYHQDRPLTKMIQNYHRKWPSAGRAIV